MALQWLWDEKCGEAIIEHEYEGEKHYYTKTLYEGNCELIFLSEWVEDDGIVRYTLYNFFADKRHMEICLGLRKNCDGELHNMFNGAYYKLTKLRLNKKKCHKLVEIVSAFVKAFDNLEIEIYTEEDKND